MPMLGDLLAAARDGTGGFLPWLRNADPGLANAVEEAAGSAMMTPTSYVRAAVSDFGRLASEEDWATLTSSLKRSEDPGTACLLAMIDWRLTVNACSEHSHHPHPKRGAADDRSDQRSA